MKPNQQGSHIYTDGFRCRDPWQSIPALAMPNPNQPNTMSCPPQNGGVADTQAQWQRQNSQTLRLRRAQCLINVRISGFLLCNQSAKALSTHTHTHPHTLQMACAVGSTACVYMYIYMYTFPIFFFFLLHLIFISCSIFSWSLIFPFRLAAICELVK